MSSSSSEPVSEILPFSRTKIVSACITVERRCAIVIVICFLLCEISLMVPVISSSVREPSADLAFGCLNQQTNTVVMKDETKQEKARKFYQILLHMATGNCTALEFIFFTMVSNGSTEIIVIHR